MGSPKRGGGSAARLLRLAGPRAVGAATLLLVLGTFLLHHSLGARRAHGGLDTSKEEPFRRAHLMEIAAQHNQQLLLDADKLAEEVAELSKELSALQGDGSLTHREKLWQEKERAGGGEQEAPVAAGDTGAAGAATGSGAVGKAAGGAAPGSDGEKALPESLLDQLVKQERQAAGVPGQRRQAPAFRVVTGVGLGSAVSDNRPEPDVVELSDEEVTRRRDEIVDAMRHAWGGYVQYAWGHDELAPVSKQGKDGFGGLGATIIDSLDTLLMMGLRDEYERALAWVSSEMSTEAAFDASVFETIIRVVGGFLAAHELAGDDILLRKSEEVAQRLLPAYNTTTGIPFNTINLKTQKVKNPNWNLKASTLAEFGTHQLEFFKLSQKTGNETYAHLSEATIRFLYDRNPGQGLMPLFVNPSTGKFTARKVSFGALGDSYYEYLLKLWVLKGRPDGDWIRDMWEQAMDEMIDRLVFTSKEGFVYIAEYDRTQVKHKMDHLVCFVPGMLALGAYTGAVTGAKADRYMEVAAGVTRTCWKMYHTQPTGLSPEYVMFPASGMRVGAPYNLLRPEALEAFYYMWRMTRDEQYRTWAWEVFQAFQMHCKADAGYSGVKDVRKMNITLDDTQQSFFLAETLKYLYLIFSPDEALDWDLWVLNTEAHPLRIVGTEGRRPTSHRQWKGGRAQPEQQQPQQQPGRKSWFNFWS